MLSQEIYLYFLLSIFFIINQTVSHTNRWSPPATSNEISDAAGDIPTNQRYNNRGNSEIRQKLHNINPDRTGNERQVRYKNHLHKLQVEQHLHKCKLWVPIEAAAKYRGVYKNQIDQAQQLQLIEVCCEGYQPLEWRGNFICLSMCANCANGFCQSPGECICYDEFVHNDNGDCVFACPLGCQNGKCYLDGSCECEPGYKLDETRKFCRPICSTGCGQNPRHNCTEPEVCGCAKGFKLTDEGCQPSCQPDCGLGGVCVEYNKCECNAGFTLKDCVCQADCYQKCDNGVCYSRNRCICNPGFIYHEHSTQCIPK